MSATTVLSKNPSQAIEEGFKAKGIKKFTIEPMNMSGGSYLRLTLYSGDDFETAREWLRANNYQLDTSKKPEEESPSGHLYVKI